MISIYLGILSGVLQIIGYVEYFKKVFGGRIRPNAASWGIWAFGAVLESSSYLFVSRDWVKDILPITCATLAVIFFLIAFKRGFFSKPTKFEQILVIIDILILLFWLITSSAILANILFLLSAIVSFIPIIRHVYNDPFAEHAQPWFFWTAAYAAMCVTVIMRWEGWEAFLYPLLFLVLHLIIALLALDVRKKF